MLKCMEKGLLSAYVKHGNHLVKGWLTPGAIQAIVSLSIEQRKASVPGGVAEIGVHHGRLFILLYLLGAMGERAVAIDLFSHQHLNSDHSGEGDLERFKKNLRRHADTDRLVIYEGDSMKLDCEQLIDLGGGPLRMISVDGGHSPEVTAHNLYVSEGALANGGIIIVDDCFNEAWPGVVDGVKQLFCTPRSIVPFGVGANKTFFCHKVFAQRYAAVLRAMDPKAVTHEFLGVRVVCFTFRPRTFNAWIRKVDAFRLFRRVYHDALSRW
jgi:Methyltransferase domain